MAGYLDEVTNRAIVTVSGTYDAAQTSITLLASEGSKLPGTSEAYNLVWFNATDFPNAYDDPNFEIVRVTGRSGDVLTVVRGQESISATTKNAAGKTYKMALSLTKKFRDDVNSKLYWYRPAFRARLSANQSIVNGSSIKLQLATEDYDQTSEFDSTTNYRFTASREVILSVSIGLKWIDVASPAACFAELRKNGTLYSRKFIRSTVASGNTDVLHVDSIKLAATDYVEAFASHGDSVARSVDSTSTDTFFAAQAVGIYQNL